MDNHTVVQLKTIAKDRGMRGYYKITKVELIHALEAARLVEQKPNIFDESIPNNLTHFHNQHLGDHQISRRKLSKIEKNIITKGMQKIKDFGERLLIYIPRKPNVVEKVLESFKNKIRKMYEKSDTLFQPIQSKSALKNFAIQHQLKRLNVYDPESFLLNSKQPITNLMINTRQTKVKLILSHMMEKVDLNSGEVIAQDSVFHSKQKST